MMTTKQHNERMSAAQKTFEEGQLNQKNTNDQMMAEQTRMNDSRNRELDFKVKELDYKRRSNLDIY